MESIVITQSYEGVGGKNKVTWLRFKGKNGKEAILNINNIVIQHKSKIIRETMIEALQTHTVDN